MCSVPLVWNDQVIGVLNVQTVEPREFSAGRLGFLETLAGLLAGLIEKHRLQHEAEAQIESCARSTRRGPTSSRSSPTRSGRPSRSCARTWSCWAVGCRRPSSPTRRTGRGGAGPGRPPGPDGRLDPREPAGLSRRAGRAVPGRPRGGGDEDDRGAGAHAPSPHPRLDLHPPAAAWPWASDEMLRRLLGYLLENASKYAPAAAPSTSTAGEQGDRAQLAVTDDGPGHPRGLARAHLRAVRPARRLAARGGHRPVRGASPGACDGRGPARRAAGARTARSSCWSCRSRSPARRSSVGAVRRFRRSAGRYAPACLPSGARTFGWPPGTRQMRAQRTSVHRLVTDLRHLCPQVTK